MKKFALLLLRPFRHLSSWRIRKTASKWEEWIFRSSLEYDLPREPDKIFYKRMKSLMDRKWQFQSGDDDDPDESDESGIDSDQDEFDYEEWLIKVRENNALWSLY
jgi:hypothetical protein